MGKRTGFMVLVVCLFVLGMAATFVAPVFAQQAKVEYSDDYRSWHYLKSMVISEGHPLFSIVPGLHNLYANDIAFQHLKSGKNEPFPQGSKFAFELLDVATTKNSVSTTKNKIVFMTQKDAAFGQTGGWGWEAWTLPGKERIVKDVDRQCANCHYQSTSTFDGIWVKWDEVKNIAR